MKWLEDHGDEGDTTLWALDLCSDEAVDVEDSYGWVWVDEHHVMANSGYTACVRSLETDKDRHTFQTLEEAQTWLVVAVTYAQITGELAPNDIHKEVV
jgi:hypothetical protein